MKVNNDATEDLTATELSADEELGNFSETSNNIDVVDDRTDYLSARATSKRGGLLACSILLLVVLLASTAFFYMLWILDADNNENNSNISFEMNITRGGG